MRFDDDVIWKALADPTRRRILDRLEGSPVTTGGMVEHFSGRLVRTAVMKHLEILASANLVRVERVGRVRYNHLERAPLERALGWLEKRARVHSENLGRLKHLAESQSPTPSASSSSRGGDSLVRESTRKKP